MRTTISIEDGLLLAAKQRGLERGMTLGAVIEDALRTVLDPARSSTVEPVLPLPVSRRRGGTRPGVDVADGARLRDVMEQT